MSELPVENKGVRLTIPTTVAPRYVPHTTKEPRTAEQVEAEGKIANIPHATSSAAPMTFGLEVITGKRIKSVKSPTHALTAPKTEEENGKQVARRVVCK